MQDFTQKLDPYPHLGAIAAEVVPVWPEHHRYSQARFRDDDDSFLQRTDEFAARALTNVAHHLPVTGYMLERAIKRGVSISCILIATRVEA